MVPTQWILEPRYLLVLDLRTERYVYAYHQMDDAEISRAAMFQLALKAPLGMHSPELQDVRVWVVSRDSIRLMTYDYTVLQFR